MKLIYKYFFEIFINDSFYEIVILKFKSKLLFYILRQYVCVCLDFYIERDIKKLTSISCKHMKMFF